MASSGSIHFDIAPVSKFDFDVPVTEFQKNPNLYFDGADVVWMMISSGLVFLMIPGAALFSSGTSTRASALSMILLPMLTAAVIAVQWWLWGYSIAFSQSNVSFWGSINDWTLHTVLSNPSGNDSGRKIPELVYALYQGMFACFTAALVSGTVVKKGRFMPFLIFITIWSTVIYNPIARWTWDSQGWSHRWGVLDFAGGTAVHITAASTAASYSVFNRLRAKFLSRHGFDPTSTKLQIRTGSTIMADSDQDTHRGGQDHRPHSMVNVVIGTVLLWFGWLGFNGGSALGANLRAVSACISTFLAACAGGATWCILDFILISAARRMHERPRRASQSSSEHDGSKLPGKFSIFAFCNGSIAGLVAITPAAGYVSCRISPLFGIVGAATCSFCLVNNFIARQLLDTLNIFVIHGIGGWVGMILTAFFAQNSVMALDGFSSLKDGKGGFLDHNWKQLGLQICDALAGMTYAGGGTILILIVMEAITYVIWKRPMEDGRQVLDADDIIERELL